MRWIDKIKVTLSQIYVGDNFKPHNKEYYCNEWWCHKIKYETIPVSKLKVQTSKIKMEPIHFYIQDDIIENGFDYRMGHIIVTSKNVIMNGHHRYKILIDNFGEEHQITVVKLLDVSSLKIYFLKFIINRLLLNLIWLFRGKKKEKHITLKF